MQTSYQAACQLPSRLQRANCLQAGEPGMDIPFPAMFGHMLWRQSLTLRRLSCY